MPAIYMEAIKWLIFPLVSVCFLQVAAYGQHYDTVSIFSQPVQMDSVVIVAARSGWDIKSFIKRVQQDTTFYKAFRSMRLVSYTAVNNIEILDRNNRTTASMHSVTQQSYSNGCRSMKVLEQNTQGDFYNKDGSYQYYTANLYDYLFFTKHTVCGENDIIAGSQDMHGSTMMEKNKYRLKQLIFNPGSKISGVPMLGDKASIFDEDQAVRYNFKITTALYEGQECYVFSIIPKAGEEKNVIYNELITWFLKSNYSIVARDYSLSYNTLVYDFHVRMKVRTQQIKNKLLPTYISYDGNWHIFTKKRERVRFSCSISY